MKKYALIYPIVICLFCSCSEKNPKVSIEVVNGVEYIHNPAIPLNPEKTVVFNEELRINGEDDEGNIFIFRPSYLAVSGRGEMLIADGQERKIHMFDQSGAFLRAFGAKGKGPGEFQRIGQMTFLPDGRLVVIDWLSRRTSYLDLNGTYLGGYAWRNPHYEIFWCDEEGITMDDRIYAGDSTQLSVKKIDFEGKELSVLGNFTPSSTHTLTKGEYSFAISLPYDPHSVLTGDRINKLLYHCKNDEYVIEVIDESGNLIRKIDRPYIPVPFMEEDRQDYFDDIDRNPNKLFGQMARDVELPTVKTITENMVVDDQGNLWVQTFETREDKDNNDQTQAAFDIFNPKGEYITRIWCSFVPFYFQDGNAYTYVSNEFGYRTLVRYRVRWRD